MRTGILDSDAPGVDRNVGENAVIVDVATSVGLDRTEAMQALASDDGALASSLIRSSRVESVG